MPGKVQVIVIGDPAAPAREELQALLDMAIELYFTEDEPQEGPGCPRGPKGYPGWCGDSDCGHSTCYMARAVAARLRETRETNEGEVGPIGVPGVAFDCSAGLPKVHCATCDQEFSQKAGGCSRSDCGLRRRAEK